MLQELLTILKSGGSLEIGALAAKLNTSPQMVTAMLDHLQRMGLLTAAQDCSGCQLASSCSHGCGSAAVPMWQLHSRAAEDPPR
mgnify:FL=1